MAWLHIPKTHSLYVAGSARSISDSDWRTRLLARSLTWNGNPSPLRSWRQRLKTVTWTMRLYGMISEPSIAALGVASWIGSLAESRANPIRSRGAVKDTTTTETSGPEPKQLSMTLNPPESSSKTWAESFGTTTTTSDLPFDDWVTQLRRDYSRRRKSALHTSENVFSFSLWRTIVVADTSGGPRESRAGEFKLSGQTSRWSTPAADMSTSDAGVWNGLYFTRDDGTKANTALTHQASQWFTPVVVEQGDSGEWSPELRAYVLNGKRRQRHLSNQVSNWRSPEASYGDGGIMEHRPGTDAKLKLRDHAANWQTPTVANAGGQMVNNKGDILLNGQARNWPTPMSAGSESPNSGSNKVIGEKSLMREAQVMVSQIWSTPMSRDDHGPTRRRKADLSGETQSFPLYFHPAPTTSIDGHTCSHKCRRLHPQFVEWLMGLPIGWTYSVLGPRNSEHLETLWCHWRRRMHLCLSLIGSNK